MRVIQLRLGTPDEIPGDIECAQLIVHQISNVLTARQAEEVLRELDEIERLENEADR